MSAKRKGVFADTPIHYIVTSLKHCTCRLFKRLIIQAYLRGHIRAVTVARLFARFKLSGA